MKTNSIIWSDHWFFLFQEKDAGRQKASDEGEESWERRWHGDHHVVGGGGGEGGSDPSDQIERAKILVID